MTSSVVRVTVETVDPGSIDVAWEIAGSAVPIEIAVGPSPDHIDHAHAVIVDTPERSTRLTGLGPGRHYVSVAPLGRGGAVLAADRRVPFEGLQNFRDIGGYPTADGGRIRWGRIFRADSLHKLTAADLDAFQQLGMKSVFDLRGDDERASNPNPFPSVQLAIAGRPRDPAAATTATMEANTDGERVLRDIYIEMLEHSATLFGHLLTGLTGPDSLPAVFHCHAGKDRTGVAAALLLLAARVDRDTVLDDYELTQRYRRFEHQQDSFERLVARGMTPEAAAGVLTAPRWAMEDALDALDDVYGGIDAYLLGPAGVAPDTLARLRGLVTD